MASLRQFARRIELRADSIVENVDRLVRQVALAVDQAVVFETPVDTGRARSNWLVSLVEPRQDEIPPYAPGRRLGKGESANAAAALAQGAAVIGMRRPGQDIVISNNVPYIGRLNEGSSAQAPANFVEAAVQSGASVVRGTRVVVSRI